MKTKKISVYLILTFGITWLCWWLLALFTNNGSLSYGTPAFMALYLLGGLAPTYTPFITLALIGEKGDIKKYLAMVFKVKVKLLWYLIALLLPLIIHLLSFLVSYLFDNSISLSTNVQAWYMIVPIFISMIIGGGLEELGWRGMMLPEIQKKYNATISSLIVGLVWGLWHLPLFYIIGVTQYQGNFPVFVLTTVLFSFLFTWVFNNSKSVLMCIFLHAMFNATVAMGFGNWTEAISANTIRIAIMIIMILFIIVFSGYKTMVKKDRIQ